MPTERTCETSAPDGLLVSGDEAGRVWPGFGHAEVEQTLPRPAPVDTAASDALPVEELHLDPADKSYMLAENAMLKQRVAELEAEVNGLYVDLGAAQDAAHNQQLILGEQMTALAVERKRAAELELAVTTLEDQCDEYAAALNDRAELCDRLRGYYMRDRVAHSAIADYVSVIGEAGWWRARAAAWKRAAKRERRAVGVLGAHIDANRPAGMPQMGCPIPAPDGYPGCLLAGRRPDCARCWAEWARKRAREEAGGDEPDTERSE